MKIKKERGFTSVDIAIAMTVVIVFASIMTSIFYSVYVSSTEAKRTATALNYTVDIFEKIGSVPFNNATEANIVQTLKSDLNISDVSQTAERNKGNNWRKL